MFLQYCSSCMSLQESTEPNACPIWRVPLARRYKTQTQEGSQKWTVSRNIFLVPFFFVMLFWLNNGRFKLLYNNQGSPVQFPLDAFLTKYVLTFWMCKYRRQEGSQKLTVLRNIFLVSFFSFCYFDSITADSSCYIISRITGSIPARRIFWPNMSFFQLLFFNQF